jgi:hypothetical protein
MSFDECSGLSYQLLCRGNFLLGHERGPGCDATAWATLNPFSMAALILSLPGWAVIIAMIGLVAAMAYILFGHFTDRH